MSEVTKIVRPAPGSGEEDTEPLIIPEKRHPIREHDLDREALKVLYRLRDAGFSGYLVGGGVRDLYLGKRPKDFDISTDARPGQIRKIFRNSRTIGRRFRLVQVYFRGGKIIEVSTLRSQSEYDLEGDEPILPSNNTFGTLSEDARRRDLTINSLFYEIENHTIIDYVGGVRDLDEGIIRVVGDPDRRMTRDPVRMLRAIRHAARNNFTIERKTWDAILRHREKLNLCPPSRIRDEILKDLRSGAAAQWASLAMESSIFHILFPFCSEQSSRQEGDRDGMALLLSLLGAMDRVRREAAAEGGMVDVPDHFLLALLILPWGMKRFALLQPRKKGQEFYLFTREIRAELDGVFGERFNLKRMSKEAIATLLANLSLFVHCQEKKNWPKWLLHKSYFPDCRKFASLLVEAMGGSPADSRLFTAGESDKGRGRVFPEKNERKGRSGGRRGGRPAFTNRKRGVFGLRNR